MSKREDRKIAVRLKFFQLHFDDFIKHGFSRDESSEKAYYIVHVSTQKHMQEVVTAGKLETYI